MYRRQEVGECSAGQEAVVPVSRPSPLGRVASVKPRPAQPPRTLVLGKVSSA